MRRSGITVAYMQITHYLKGLFDDVKLAWEGQVEIWELRILTDVSRKLLARGPGSFAKARELAGYSQT